MPLNNQKTLRTRWFYDSSDFRVQCLIVLLITLLGFAIYANSLTGEFIWDDEYLIKNNPFIKNWVNIGSIFSENIGAGTGREWNSYRPFQMFTYMGDYSLWKLDVRGYHLTNILLHILATLTLYWFSNILFGDRLLSLLTSIFFLVHPIHTEAIAYISGRADSLALLFLLLCFIFYIKALNKQKLYFYLFTIVTYIAALLSRENTLILPLLLLLYHSAFQKKVSSKRFIPIVIIATIYVVVRLSLLRDLLPHLSSTTTVLQRLPGFFVALTNYIRLLFLPFNLHMEYGNRLFSFSEPQAIIGAIILFLLLVYSFINKKRNRLAYFSISWFFISLLPVSNLYPLILAYMAEHWVYIPSIGFFLLLGKSLSSLYRRVTSKILAISIILCVLGFYICVTINQNSYWRNPISLYERTLKYAPHSVRTLNSLGLEYKDIGKSKEAISLFKRAIALIPDEADIYNNLALTYKNIGSIAEAISLYKKAILIDPSFAEAYNNLGVAYSAIGKQKEARDAYKRAIEINQNFAIAYNNLGNAYLFAGEREKAIHLYKKALELNPDYAEVYNNLAVAYYYERQYSLAVEYCNKAISLGIRVNPKLLEYLEPFRDRRFRDSN